MKTPKVTPEQWVEIINLYRQGYSLKEVAAKYGISTGYIYNFMRELADRGIEIKREKKVKDTLYDKVLDLLP